MIPREQIAIYEQHAANAHDLVRGLVGGSSTMLGFIISHLAQLEAWLRVTSLVVGIAVGIATFVQIIRRRK